MKRSIQNLLRLAMVACAAFTLSSCLTVKGNLIKPVGDLYFNEPLVDSGLVYIEAEFYRFAEGGMTEPVYVPVQTENLLAQIEVATRECYPFANYSFDPADKDEADFIIHYEVLHSYNWTTSLMAMSVTGATLGLIPTAVKDTYEMEITVTTIDGRQIHKKQYEDYTRTWMHLLFLPFGATMNTNTNKVLVNMIKASYKHLQFNEALLAADFP